MWLVTGADSCSAAAVVSRQHDEYGRFIAVQGSAPDMYPPGQGDQRRLDAARREKACGPRASPRVVAR